jgi:hypothetical protein
MRKRATLLLIVALTASLLMVNFAPASAALPKPSVPEFTVEFGNYVYLELRISPLPPITIIVMDSAIIFVPKRILQNNELDFTMLKMGTQIRQVLNIQAYQ